MSEQQQILETLIAAAPGIRNGNVSVRSLPVFSFFAPVRGLANPFEQYGGGASSTLSRLCAISYLKISQLLALHGSHMTGLYVSTKKYVLRSQFAPIDAFNTPPNRSTSSGSESALLALYSTLRTGERSFVHLARTCLNSQLQGRLYCRDIIVCRVALPDLINELTFDCFITTE